jgi:hypothetical protein
MPIQTAADSISNSVGSPYGFKNRIINGAMAIDQRNAGASVTITTDNTFTLDRWSTAATASSKFSVQQSTTAATGFTNSLLATSLSAYSVGSGDIFAFKHTIEGLNVADLGWGTVNAQTITVSFWVRSSLTGTFGGALQNGDQNRSYPFSFTISAANTFEYKTVTIAGDTSGTWLTNNGKGLLLWINLGTGSTGSGTAGAWAGAAYWAPTGATSVVGTSGATFYITGVQLEKGSQATAFDYRDYGNELRLCQRYYEKCYPQNIVPGTSGYQYCEYTTCNYTNNASYFESTFKFQVIKRAAPTMTAYDSAGNSGRSSYYVNGSLSNDKSITFGGAGPTDYKFYFYSDNTTSKGGMAFGWTASAEL